MNKALLLLLSISVFLVSCSDDEPEIEPLPDSNISIDYNPLRLGDQALFSDFMIMHDEDFNPIRVKEVEAYRVMKFQEPAGKISLSTLDLFGSSASDRRYRLRVFHDIPSDLDAVYGETYGERNPIGHTVEFQPGNNEVGYPIEYLSAPNIAEFQSGTVPLFIPFFWEDETGLDQKITLRTPVGASSLPLIVRTLDGIWGNIHLTDIKSDTLLTYGEHPIDTIAAEHAINLSATYPGEAHFSITIDGQSKFEESYNGIELVRSLEIPIVQGQVTFPDFNQSYSNLELTAIHEFYATDRKRELMYINRQEAITEMTQPTVELVVNGRNLGDLELELTGDPEYMILQFNTEKGTIQIYSKTLVDEGIENLFQIFENPLLRFLAIDSEEEIQQCKLTRFSLVEEATFARGGGEAVINRLLGIPVETAKANVVEFEE